MAVTPFQARVLKLLAANRIKEGETYVAGGLALNHQLHRPRVSHDIDVFSDTDEALYFSVNVDRETLKSTGLTVAVKRELPFMIEVTVSDINVESGTATVTIPDELKHLPAAFFFGFTNGPGVE